jgi:WD40 repeat protein
VIEGGGKSVAYSPDGKTLATGYIANGMPGSNGGVVLWDVTAQRRLASPLAILPKAIVNSVAFSPDGKTLAACYLFLTVKAPAAGKKLGETDSWIRKAMEIANLLFPAGKKLGETLLWDINPDSWIRKAREIANRDFTPEESRLYSLGPP